MLQCAKHWFLIPSSSSSQTALKSNNKQWLEILLSSLMGSELSSLLILEGGHEFLFHKTIIASFNFYLGNYHDKVFVYFLFCGWLINYQGPLPSSTFSNHPFASINTFLQSYVAKELAHHSICGPFTSNPLSTDCVISPLLCIMKHDSADLSFPKGCSVNDGIAEDWYLNEPSKLHSPGINHLVAFINQLGHGCHVCKKDLNCTYRQIPVDSMDYPKVGFQVDGQSYFHTVFPFGLCSATLACQRTTQSIVYILTTMGLLVDMYVDDFYGVATPSHSSNTFQTMNTLFQKLGFTGFNFQGRYSLPAQSV